MSAELCLMYYSHSANIDVGRAGADASSPNLIIMETYKRLILLNRMFDPMDTYKRLLMNIGIYMLIIIIVSIIFYVCGFEI